MALIVADTDVRIDFSNGAQPGSNAVRQARVTDIGDLGDHAL